MQLALLEAHQDCKVNEEGYEEGSSTCSTSHEEEGDEGHEEVRSCLSIVLQKKNSKIGVCLASRTLLNKYRKVPKTILLSLVKCGP